MFWILRKSKFKGNSLLNVIRNNTLDICSSKKNYDKLTQQNNHNSVENIKLEKSIINNPKESTMRNEAIDYANCNSIEEKIMDPVSNNNDNINNNNYCNYYDEALTCNVCDTSFDCSKQLFSHKLEKRHYRCDVCDSFFQTLMALEHHKEAFEHWFDDEEDDYTDFSSNESIPEELESLL